MAFVTIPNISGKIFVPEKRAETIKKRKCHDCFSCQMCSESRCKLCRSEEPCEDTNPEVNEPEDEVERT
ncbi:MAG: hypothetical protein EHM85_10895 [Desulfobacteraceae bacterium]|nr:MAG: hypothetical protein EHM85_10895 [Desulfobacteraceae bacterium]